MNLTNGIRKHTRTLILMAAFLLTLTLGCAKDSKCADDYGCNAGRTCEVATGKCIALVCQDKSGCPVGFSCTNNACTKENLGQAPEFKLNVTTETVDVDYGNATD